VSTPTDRPCNQDTATPSREGERRRPRAYSRGVSSSGIRRHDSIPYRTRITLFLTRTFLRQPQWSARDETRSP
jgi:hypothetical protein